MEGQGGTNPYESAKMSNVEEALIRRRYYDVPKGLIRAIVRTDDIGLSSDSLAKIIAREYERRRPRSMSGG